MASALPEPPVNVQVELHDGTVIPVDTFYLGEADGTHTWAVIDCPPTEQIKHVHIDSLPAKTTITFSEGFTG